MKIAVVGGGAAGCFCAVNIKKLRPEAEVTVYDAGAAPMRKLAVTGGGRCNITNTFEGVDDLRKVYPRGHNIMKRLLRAFSPEDTVRWWESEGVALHAEERGCVFPDSQDAMQVVRTLERLMRRSGVRLETGRRITEPEGLGDIIVVATGGGLPDIVKSYPKLETEPVTPALFPVKCTCGELRALSGIIAPEARVSLPGTKFSAAGELLITDFGFSGPAELRLSSYASRYLSEKQCRCGMLVDWLGLGREGAEELLIRNIAAYPQKNIGNVPPEGLSARLWELILARAGVSGAAKCSQLQGGKALRRLASALGEDLYELDGRAAFKGEIVRAGGIAAASVRPDTLEAREYPGLYFAGEVLDIDGITGGFNLQAAWSTAMAVARSVAEG